MTTTGASQNRPLAVLGVDGSEASRHALLWLLAKRALAEQIEIVATYSISAWAAPYGLRSAVPNLGSYYREGAEARAQAVLDGVEDARIGELSVFESSAGRGLLEASQAADLLVVGSSGHSSVGAALLGSVSSHCVRHSRIPVAVIPPTAPISGSLTSFVVGVDGSANGQAALQWAIDHVDPAGVVNAVAAFSNLTMPEGALAISRRAAEKVLQEAVGSCRNDRNVKIDQIATPGDPRIVLAEATEEADVLVVGQRGRRTVAHLLLGSTTTSLLHGIVVPTVVVPDSPHEK